MGANGGEGRRHLANKFWRPAELDGVEGLELLQDGEQVDIVADFVAAQGDTRLLFQGLLGGSVPLCGSEAAQ